MNSHHWIKGCRLTREHVLLLRACLKKGDEALSAARAWDKSIDIQTLDPNSSRLLPLLYVNLREQTEDVSRSAGRIKGYYRHTWSKNRIILETTTTALADLADSGIETMALKGLHLLSQYYGDAGSRPMNDVDVLVRPDAAADAMRRLREDGWITQSPTPENLIPVRNSTFFTNRSGHRLDLHWHLLLEDCRAEADERWWAAAETTDVEGLTIKALCPTHLLFHVMIYGLSTYHVPPLRWFADAGKILSSSGDRIDWNAITELAEEMRLVAPVQEAVAAMQVYLDADIPQEKIRTVLALRPTFADRHEHRVKMRTQKYLGILPMLWFCFKRVKRQRPSPRISFPRYLQYALCLRRLWNLPWFIVSGVVQRSYRIFVNPYHRAGK
ncbi:MAG: nucleotidyltransferase family protein [Verrucomicrobia bacterium]|nr:nucleotidyltransferase family protein [Verrucomicrobiota bacterium]